MDPAGEPRRSCRQSLGITRLVVGISKGSFFLPILQIYPFERGGKNDSTFDKTLGNEETPRGVQLGESQEFPRTEFLSGLSKEG